MKYVILIYALFATGCSSVQLTFFFADRFIASRVAKSFDLSSRQEDMLRQQIYTDLNSNKPKIGLLLDQILVKIDRMSKSNEVIRFEEFSQYDKQMIELRFALVSILNPSLDQFIKIAHDKNIKFFGQNIESKTGQNKVDGFESLMKFFLGSITKQQSIIFQNYISENSEFYLLQSEARKDFSSKILAKTIPDDKTKFIFSYLTGDNSIRSKEYAESYTLYRKRSLNMWYEIWQTVTPKQRKNLIENLEKYRRQIQETFH